jgi:hypothetical protein
MTKESVAKYLFAHSIKVSLRFSLIPSRKRSIRLGRVSDLAVVHFDSFHEPVDVLLSEGLLHGLFRLIERSRVSMAS